MDKFEEIFDHIVDAKRHNIRADVFNKVNIQNTKKYFRMVTDESKMLTETQKNNQMKN